jgi:hypothetical protein
MQPEADYHFTQAEQMKLRKQQQKLMTSDPLRHPYACLKGSKVSVFVIAHPVA